MAAVVAFVGPGTLILGGATPSAFSCDLTAGRIEDVSPVYSEVTGCGTVSRNGAPDVELTVSVVQDLATQTSLQRYSWQHHNEVVDFIFIPTKTQATAADISPTVPGYTGQVLLTRLPIGGNSTSLATGERTWKVQGDVQEITAPPSAAVA